MATERAERTGQKSGQADAPAGYGWGDYIEALIEEQGTLAAVAWKLVERGLVPDAASSERAIRRLRGRGQRDGGLIGQRLLRTFGVPRGVAARVRWMGLYHSPFNDLPLALCLDQLRLWDRPPVSASRARVWIELGLASAALRQRSFAEAQTLLDKAASSLDLPDALVEHRLAMGYLASRLDPDPQCAERASRPHVEAARAALDAGGAAIDPEDVACFRARIVDHEAFAENRRGAHDRALALYRSLPAEDTHPFASYRRDAGLAYGLYRSGARDEAIALALRACDHAGDGGYVRLRAMGLLMVARIQGRPHNAATLARARAIALRLADAELSIRVERLARGAV